MNIIINVDNKCADSYFCGNCETFFLDSLINQKLKRTVLI